MNGSALRMASLSSERLSLVLSNTWGKSARWRCTEQRNHKTMNQKTAAPVNNPEATSKKLQLPRMASKWSATTTLNAAMESSFGPMEATLKAFG